MPDAYSDNRHQSAPAFRQGSTTSLGTAIMLNRPEYPYFKTFAADYRGLSAGPVPVGIAPWVRTIRSIL
jgi:hypothetical protein